MTTQATRALHLRTPTIVALRLAQLNARVRWQGLMNIGMAEQRATGTIAEDTVMHVERAEDIGRALHTLIIEEMVRVNAYDPRFNVTLRRRR